MKNTKRIFLLLLLCLAFENSSTAQDRKVVQLLHRHIHKEPTAGIYLKNFEMHSDTITETNERNMSIDKDRELENALEKKDLLFVDKKGRGIVACRWNGEAIYGDLKYYYKNGKVKKEGSNLYGQRWGDWNFYSRKGKLKRTKKYEDCTY